MSRPDAEIVKNPLTSFLSRAGIGCQWVEGIEINAAIKRIEELEQRIIELEKTRAQDVTNAAYKSAMEIAEKTMAENKQLREKLNNQANHGYWPSGAEIMPADKEWLRGGR